MSTNTSRLGLLKPDGSETVNVGTQLNNNLDSLDLNMNFRVCTSTTRPSTAYAGLSIRETDTGRCYVSNGSAPVSASWVEVFSNGASFTLTGTSLCNLSGTASGTDKLATLVTGDSVDRFRLAANGRMEWGSGSATRDTNLYRSAANTLKTDDVFSAQVETTTSGATAGTGWSLTSFTGRKTCGVCSVWLVLSRTGVTLTGDAQGNIADETMVTLPAGWIPPENTQVIFDRSGVNLGGATIQDDGQCVLKMSVPNGTVTNGGTVSFFATYVL